MTYIKTELGQQAFKDRAPALIKLRAAFILIDGKRTMQDVLRATAGMGIVETDIAQLLALGYIAEDAASESAPSSAATTPQPPASETNPNELYLRGYAIATQLTAGLGLRGFRLNLAVESASGYQQLVELVPKIREVVGADKCRPLEEALGL
ncbi:hypothetical protein SAMN05216303_108215 [Rhodoferax sp. OV413]|uniref:hypothetical protein n=1 Tax=Rhodoferax sp. OV413 TaxID=1855285 RepID=UPI00088A6680|nr:hypothetical protein [Rhodoferax sp. OV413]SDP87826.1 hypothetical protein SAMN05216303_108215 [Rhodoferax sp. OV413]